MRVKMIFEISGLRDGQPWPKRGGVIDVPTDEAEQLIAAGMAEVPGKVETAKADEPEVEAPKEPETATAPVAKVETATPPAPKAPRKTAARKTTGE